jgi:hypothetical protein
MEPIYLYSVQHHLNQQNVVVTNTLTLKRKLTKQLIRASTPPKRLLVDEGQVKQVDMIYFHCYGKWKK